MAHFAYVDDAGAYKADRNSDFIRRNPFYLRVCVLIPAAKWKRLTEIHTFLKTRYRGCGLHELKWQHLWQLKRRDKNQGGLSKKANVQLLNITYEEAIDYTRILLGALNECEASVWAGVTSFEHFKTPTDRDWIEKWHFQDIMQRAEMELSTRKEQNDVVVLFCDEMATTDEEIIDEHYSSLLSGIDPFVNYSRINESVCFVNSSTCTGVQLADFTGGVINGFLRGFFESEAIFKELVSPWMRRDSQKGIIGYGIYEIPKDKVARQFLVEKFKDHAIKPQINMDDEVPF